MPPFVGATWVASASAAWVVREHFPLQLLALFPAQPPERGLAHSLARHLALQPVPPGSLRPVLLPIRS
jgi:hypothetical protein